MNDLLQNKGLQILLGISIGAGAMYMDSYIEGYLSVVLSAILYVLLSIACGYAIYRALCGDYFYLLWSKWLSIAIMLALEGFCIYSAYLFTADVFGTPQTLITNHFKLSTIGRKTPKYYLDILETNGAKKFSTKLNQDTYYGLERYYGKIKIVYYPHSHAIKSVEKTH